MTFKQHEIEFMAGADLGRLATVQPDGTVQVSPVGFTYNADLGTIDVSGYRMSKSQKFRNLTTNPNVAFVVDDIVSRDPWRVRCLEIRGTAEQAQAATTGRGGRRLDGGTRDSTRRSSGSRRAASSPSASTTRTPNRISCGRTRATSDAGPRAAPRERPRRPPR